MKIILNVLTIHQQYLFKILFQCTIGSLDETQNLERPCQLPDGRWQRYRESIMMTTI